MFRKLSKAIYNYIVPPATSWLPRYYTILKLININKGVVLDASCGTGDICIELAKRGVWVVGINISKEEITLARKKAEKEGLAIDFVIGDLTKIPFKDNCFSQIISLDTLEHIEDDDSVLQEFGRVLRPAKKLMLSVPYGATNSAQLFREQRLLRKLIPRLFYTDTLYSSKRWLEATEEDAMKKMGHLRHYSINSLQEKTNSWFKITHHEYALKKFASLATDITYGIKGFSFLKPFIFFIAVRLDRIFRSNKGYLLVAEMEKKKRL